MSQVYPLKNEKTVLKKLDLSKLEILEITDLEAKLKPTPGIQDLERKLFYFLFSFSISRVGHRLAILMSFYFTKYTTMV